MCYLKLQISHITGYSNKFFSADQDQVPLCGMTWTTYKLVC